VPPLPVVSATEVIKTLEKLGYHIARVNGSHHRMKHPQRPSLTVPVHNRDMSPGTLRSIIRDAQLTVEEFLDLL
jgi:predicted RNA binding protein YcfA (HicA-like mRNA interferase family)